MFRRMIFLLIAATIGTGLFPSVAAIPAVASGDQVKQAVAVGTGGAVASVNVLATAAGIRVLQQGGNAVDAAIASAAVLGVVEPFSCGIGGGGFMVIYDARRHRLTTIDSREKAPQAFRADSFIDPATGKPIPFPEQVTSGLGVGVPGTLLAWQTAAEDLGTRPLSALLTPAINIANEGFVVNPVFAQQTADNLSRFRDFSSTRALFLTSSGQAPAVGSKFYNPDLANTYRLIAQQGSDVFYQGPIARNIVDTVQHPPLVPGATRNVRPGLMSMEDLADYDVVDREPVATSYRGLTIAGMGPPSSGGSTIGEALNILEGFDLGGMSRVQALHRYLESTRLAYADRNAYLGDPDVVDVPLTGLLSKDFAAQRRALIGPTAATSPVAPGNPYPFQEDAQSADSDREGPSTTHLTVADRWGNFVSYTFTIEQIGGSGMVVPGRGFLLNNELTDFEPVPGRANSPGPGKRPRSSMSPTIVFLGGRPVLALGSPGGSTIITTVLQILLNKLDFGMSLPNAIAAPRASQRNTTLTSAEPAFINSPEAAGLYALGQRFSTVAEIGAATGIAVLPDGRLQAAAEPVRRGGGSAMVVRPG
ncbi:MAG TPA: gamma-glutamyltransferase [Candidatus Angelobacter sp.]|nr:gamma-glutamyltransferase [Candidatus Angelobacter sp.]